jgi:hypothetical protein
MIGSFHIADSEPQRTWVYSAGRSTIYQTWQKPPGISFVHIIAIGGGGGGGGGRANDDSALVYGAVGGASSCFASCFYPAYSIPDVLYINVGAGGAGGIGTGIGVNGGDGSSGNATRVGWRPNTTTIFNLCAATAGAGGVGGRTTIQGAASTGAPPAVSAFAPLGQAGIRSSVIGQNSTANNTSATPGINNNFRTGPGGNGERWGSGASTFGAMPIVGTPGLYVNQPVASGGTNTGDPGSSIDDLANLFFTGGSGGAANRTGAAGVGGFGGHGSGGGGGAAGNVIGSNGGKGGDGLVIITVG